MSVETRRVIRLPANPTLDGLRVSNEAVPQPGPGEVLVRIHASSLNFHDYLVAAGHIPQPEGRIPMSDGAGEVVKLGENFTWPDVGQRVIGAFFPDWLDGPAQLTKTAAISGETIDGFAADHVVVPAASLCPIPPGWSYEEAACLPCAGLTAWRILMIEAELKAGDRVLLPGSGGLAVFCHQIAAAAGITAIATSSSDVKLQRLASLGARYGINYGTTPDWSGRVLELTDGCGVDAVLEIGGQSTFAQSVAAVRDQGRIITVGSTANDAPVLPLRDVVMRSIRVQGMAVGSRAHMQEYLAFVTRHDLRPVIDCSFPLERLGEAFAYQLEARHFGKIVVTL